MPGGAIQEQLKTNPSCPLAVARMEGKGLWRQVSLAFTVQLPQPAGEDGTVAY